MPPTGPAQVEPRLPNTILPLSDRVLFALANRRGTARALSQLLRTDLQTVHKTLGGLEDEGLVMREPGDGGAALFSTAPGVEVAYRPGRVVVRRPGTPAVTDAPAAEDPAQPADGRCRAVTARGTRCRMRALSNGLCFHHGPG